MPSVSFLYYHYYHHYYYYDYLPLQIVDLLVPTSCLRYRRYTLIEPPNEKYHYSKNLKEAKTPKFPSNLGIVVKERSHHDKEKTRISN